LDESKNGHGARREQRDKGRYRLPLIIVSQKVEKMGGVVWNWALYRGAVK